MAKKAAAVKRPERDDFHIVQDNIPVSGDRVATEWMNLQTQERGIFLPQGVHPLENQNALIAREAENELANPETQAFAFEDTAEESAADRVAALLSEARSSQGRAQVIVSRLESDGSWTHCKKYAPEEFEDDNFDIVRAEFGPGEYRFALYATSDTSGKFVKRAGLKMRLAPLMNPQTSAQGVSPDLVRILDRMDQRINDLATRAHQPVVNPMQQMSEMANLFKVFKEMMPPPPAAPDPMVGVKQLVEMLTVAKTIRKEIEPPEPEEKDPLSAIAIPAMELIGKAMQNNQAQPQGFPVVQVPPQIAAQDVAPNPVAVMPPTDAPVTAASYVPQNEQEAQAIKELNELITLCNSMARMRMDSNSAADMIYDRLPEEVLDAMVNTPNWWELLTQLFPSAIDHKAWYHEMRNAIVKIDSEQDTDDDPPESTQGAANVRVPGTDATGKHN